MKFPLPPFVFGAAFVACIGACTGTTTEPDPGAPESNEPAIGQPEPAQGPAASPGTPAPSANPEPAANPDATPDTPAPAANPEPDPQPNPGPDVPVDCEYPGGTQGFAVGNTLAPHSWATGFNADDATAALQLADAPCNNIEWSPFDTLVFIAIPAW